MALYAHIVGWGKYIPEKVVTNDAIAEFMDTSDDWIKSRTGISERRFADPTETTASMAIAAARLALDRARLVPKAIDLIIVATLSPEQPFPATASLVQDAIGAKNAGAFDLSAACSGFIYALSLGSAMIQSGSAGAVLVIGSETVSRFLNKKDRTTYPLFGDGAGAIVLQAHRTPGGVMSTVLGSDGSGAEHLSIPAGGSKLPASQATVDKQLHCMQMNGREVYRFATRIMGKVAKQACDQAGVDLNEIDLFIPHQANIRIIRSASKYLKISDDKVFTNLEKYGNTSTASIPIALCEAIEQGRVQNNDKLVMVGFGGGLSWGATVVKWGLPMPYKRRTWWYRSIRWFVYRWARVRSTYLRVSRRLESLVRNGRDDHYLIPDKEDRKDKTQENGHDPPPERKGSEPEQIETPPELPATTEPVEVEEQVLEVEQPPVNGSKKHD